MRVFTGSPTKRHKTLTNSEAPQQNNPIDTEADELAQEIGAAEVIEVDPTPEPAGVTFADLGVMTEIADALREVGIVNPFPIQAMAIPIALEGTDMIGQARTGTGKTLAFGVTLLQRISLAADPENVTTAPQALVVAPTRELASQVSKDITLAASVTKARVLTVYGGVAYEPQLDALAAGVDVVVGTPGRLLDLMQRRVLDLSQIRIVVLDEADEMLDLGFLPDVERLLAKTPKSRQTMLFSATMPKAIVSLSRAHLNQPVNIRAESSDANHTVPDTTQFIYQAHDLDKPEIVSRVLQGEGRDKMMIFCRTKRSAQRLSEDLAERGFAAAPIHGDLNQQARERALKKFRAGTIDVLVATDVAARGIDVTGVSHVINYECPDDEMAYVHRIGRTGRAGAKGIAITFVDWADTTRWKVINKALELKFFEPVETYSTSEHLFTEQSIPEGTKGRIAPPSDQPPRRRNDERRDDGRRSDGRSEEQGTERKREPRKASTRQRTRTRNGRPVERNGERQHAGHQHQEHQHQDHKRNERKHQEQTAVSPDASSSNDAETGERKPRRRRRSRGGRGGGEGQQAAQPVAEQASADQG